jgi:hypothetical protein
MTTHDDTARDLRNELCSLDLQLYTATDKILRDCTAAGTDPYTARTPDGGYLLAPLLTARAHVLAALTHLGADDEPFDPATIGRTP